MPVTKISAMFGNNFNDYIGSKLLSTRTPEAITRSPAIAEGPRDAGVPVEIW